MYVSDLLSATGLCTLTVVFSLIYHGARACLALLPEPLSQLKRLPNNWIVGARVPNYSVRRMPNLRRCAVLLFFFFKTTSGVIVWFTQRGLEIGPTELEKLIGIRLPDVALRDCSWSQQSMRISHSVVPCNTMDQLSTGVAPPSHRPNNMAC